MQREPAALQRQEVPEEEEEGELQMQREPAALQRQKFRRTTNAARAGCSSTPGNSGGRREELQMQREPATLQRQENPEEEDEELQMKPDTPRVGLEGGKVPPAVESAINRARGAGQPLDEAVQAQMGTALGHDFSRVQVHTGAEAHALNKQLSAKAFTTGRDIFFRQGEYNPGSGSGRELLAHELAHVVQQSTGRVRGDGVGMTAKPAGDTFEREADSAARGLATQRRDANRDWQTLPDSQVAQRTCWQMNAQQTASFVEEGIDGHIYSPDQVYWRMQPTPELYRGSYFAPVIDNMPDVWKIAEDQIVTAEERSQLAVKYEWVKEWKYLVLYSVKPGDPKERPYGGIAREQPRDERMAYSGGAYQAVFPSNRVAEILAVVPVYEVGAEETRAQPGHLAANAPGRR
jgi:hypothetical protein